jgi:hypothetical protein
MHHVINHQIFHSHQGAPVQPCQGRHVQPCKGAMSVADCPRETPSPVKGATSVADCPRDPPPSPARGATSVARRITSPDLSLSPKGFFELFIQESFSSNFTP